MYPSSDIPDNNENPTFSQELQEDVAEEEEEEELIITWTNSPLPIQDPSSQWQTQPVKGILTEGSTSRDLLQTTSEIIEGWMPLLRTIPTQKEWNQWLESRIEEAFQGE